ncbi:hypothetical protein AMAG_03814 [Allomyces macrogynus ATCC 38327]|uniref:Uncharacterized protein n=1 Tax=Allomyces macrogynus (strain ATCC 38327) TaxID=578462 RepID=A0A0L0SAU6_ALLM3|nr:hypothetical protein AMAG_03814 [Allomyces macrogynus ATCC 38327]|eukprot:KNE59552.1 hypothetical protein AMAG_03814 [Allomyces macrogynus ATCC 38327]
MHAIWTDLCTLIDQAKLLYKVHADCKCKATPDYQVGDNILILLLDSTTYKKLHKFTKHYLTPAVVKCIIKWNVVEVELPLELEGVHPMFNITKLKLWTNLDAVMFLGQNLLPPELEPGK